MTQPEWQTVDNYLTDLLVRPDDTLNSALAASTDAGLPSIAVSPCFGKFLHLLATIRGARNILEIGTLGGYSTIWLARALPPGGRLITLEADPKHAEVARANIASAGLADIVDLRLGRAIDTLPQLEAEGLAPFDFIFIDADKPSTPEYFQWSVRLSRPGTVIIVDNVVRKGAVADPATDDPKVQGIRKFNELLAAEPRVTATTLQTVGVKGYDGFAIIVVNGD